MSRRESSRTHSASAGRIHSRPPCARSRTSAASLAPTQSMAPCRCCAACALVSSSKRRTAASASSAAGGSATLSANETPGVATRAHSAGGFGAGIGPSISATELIGPALLTVACAHCGASGAGEVESLSTVLSVTPCSAPAGISTVLPASVTCQDAGGGALPMLSSGRSSAPPKVGIAGGAICDCCISRTTWCARSR